MRLSLQQLLPSSSNMWFDLGGKRIMEKPLPVPPTRYLNEQGCHIVSISLSLLINYWQLSKTPDSERIWYGNGVNREKKFCFLLVIHDVKVRIRLITLQDSDQTRFGLDLAFLLRMPAQDLED